MGNNLEVLIDLIKSKALCLFRGGAVAEPDYTGETNRIRVTTGLIDPEGVFNLSFSPRTGEAIVTGLEPPGPDSIKSIPVGRKFIVMCFVTPDN